MTDSLAFCPDPHARVVAVPAFDDNYLWLVLSPDRRRAAVVDPGDAQAIESALSARDLTLDAILLTHHHRDHTGGVAALTARWSCPVYGPRAEGIPGVDHALDDGDAVNLAGLDLRFRVIGVPGHTRGHIAYFAERLDPTDPPALFCGDTLFAGGCGRLFEGTAAQMLDSLARLRALPDDTRVYCAHEYTLANLRFAVAVDPDNAALQTRFALAQARRARGEPTVPGEMAAERATNPFLRTHLPALQAAAARHLGRAPADAAECFGAIRDWKNQFR
ncbi:MAG: hydroxyacylglutathione hydrolase [Betaproteobacteria bacterium]|nr:hydroxyacylglutathione hydrolase [Betaproteobacteria bacterium]